MCHLCATCFDGTDSRLWNWTFSFVEVKGNKVFQLVFEGILIRLGRKPVFQFSCFFRHVSGRIIWFKSHLPFFFLGTWKHARFVIILVQNLLQEHFRQNNLFIHLWTIVGLLFCAPIENEEKTTQFYFGQSCGQRFYRLSIINWWHFFSMNLFNASNYKKSNVSSRSKDKSHFVHQAHQNLEFCFLRFPIMWHMSSTK